MWNWLTALMRPAWKALTDFSGYDPEVQEARPLRRAFFGYTGGSVEYDDGQVTGYNGGCAASPE